MRKLAPAPGRESLHGEDLVLRRLMVEYQRGSAPVAEQLVVEVKVNMSKDGKSVKISSIKMPETR